MIFGSCDLNSSCRILYRLMLAIYRCFLQLCVIHFQYNLAEFEEAWQLAVPEGMKTGLHQLEVSYLHNALPQQLYLCGS